MLRLICYYKTQLRKTKYILACDYNKHLIRHDKYTDTEQFLNHILSNSCFPTITQPTSFSAAASMLMGNIMCKIIWQTS